MAKSTRGGKAGATTVFTMRQPAFHPVTNPRPTPQPTPQPIQPAQSVNAISASYDAFLKMTDDQKADVILKGSNTQVPAFLAQNDLQRVLYSLSLNDKPTLVADSVLDALPGKVLYRNVNEAIDASNRMRFSADEVAAQNIKGSVTRVSDTGGSVHGRGIYFADNYSSSGMYGNTMGNIKKTAVIRAKLNSNARTIAEHMADSGLAAEIRSGSKLGRAISNMDRHSQKSLWALAKGYNVIVASNGYHIVLNRTALTASDAIKAKGYNW